MKGIMIDCSRNAVMKPEAIKRFVDIMSALQYDTLMLYTEDTYEVDDEPLFGYMRGRYSKKEIMELDEYCQKKEIELIPCIQTLAHLNTMFKWSSEYECIRDCDDILLADEERTYILIDNMFKTISKCFKSKKIHIGMDEANMVGLGKYLEKHGYEKRFDIINKHLHKVCRLASNYGLKPMIWSDMFCKLAMDSCDYYALDGNTDAISKQAGLPENISLVYWDYYSGDYDRYVKMLNINKAFGKQVIFAGGAWTWKGFAPDNSLSMAATKPAIKACGDEQIENVFLTAWGDDGGECSRFAALPALTYAACLLNGAENEVKEKFTEVTNMKFDDFMLLDKLDKPSEKLAENPSKYLLYNDPFSGVHDYKIEKGVNLYYADLTQKLKSVKPSQEYKAMFDFYISLCDVLSVKSELGIQTRAAYDARDKKTLLNLAQNDYSVVIEKIENCYNNYKILWFNENKPFGFEIQDIRFGGLIKRLENCKNRIIDYCNGNCKSIPELDERILDNYSRGTTWARTVTAGVISHIV